MMNGMIITSTTISHDRYAWQVMRYLNTFKNKGEIINNPKQEKIERSWSLEIKPADV